MKYQDDIRWHDREIRGERIEMGPRVDYYLGPSLVFRRCHLILRLPARSLMVGGVEFIDCTLEMKHELKNLRFEGAYFQGCQFTGRMSGLDFGHWPESPHKSGIEHCDFTQARLHLCQFFNCDMKTLSLPRWPCFTVLNPSERAAELKSLPWPGRTRVLVDDSFPEPPGLKAFTAHAPTCARAFDATEEALRRVLEQAGGVLF